MNGVCRYFAGLVQSALGIVVGLHGLTIFIHCAIPLTGDVEDFAELDVAPDLGPLRIVVSAQRVAIGVGGRLVVALREEHFADAIAGQRAVADWR